MGEIIVSRRIVMEPKSYYKNLVNTYANHDKNASLDVIEPMASVPASMKLREKGIHLVVKDGKVYGVNPGLASALTRYCEKSGVLETALTSIESENTAEAVVPSVVLDAEAQLAD